LEDQYLNIKILIIEDDPVFFDALSELVSDVCVSASITHVSNQEHAFEIIERCVFDLILLDLSIPKYSESFDDHPEYGHEVLTTARRVAIGTPIIVLTGSTAEPFITSMLKLSESTDIWGSGKRHQLVSFHAKHKLDSFHEILSEYARDFEELNNVEVERGGIELDESEIRLIRIFARKFGGVRCSVGNVPGGLSGAKVLRLTTTKDTGDVVHSTICKLGASEKIKVEDERYNRHIVTLPPQATPRKVMLLEHGAKNKSGIFYSLAEGYNFNAFSPNFMAENSDHLIGSLSGLMSSWCVTAQSRKRISDVRRVLLTDEKADALISSNSLEWAKNFESNYIQLKWGVSHGDLHGFNILVSESGMPLLIDYGDTQEGPHSLDPITLELSLLYHADAPCGRAMQRL
jgi:CheY-like chemotaxis protein